VLGASNLTYADVTISQKVADFVPSHVRALEYFVAAPPVWVRYADLVDWGQALETNSVSSQRLGLGVNGLFGA
jgi:transposase